MQDYPKSAVSEPQSEEAANPTPNQSPHERSERVEDDFAEQALRLFEQAQRAGESATAAARKTMQENPTLAVAGAVAIGAAAVLLLRNRASRPESAASRMQRGIERQARSIRRAVRQELRDHDFTSRIDHVGSTLSSIDLKPFLRPILEQASEIAGKAQARLTEAAK
ncbi:MAG: hypothetical protein JNM89_05345 [Hyphomicrobiaceae bacterium]|nr:hypothetical protein [Hyphomicrobiaceae bacterium]